MRSAVMEALQDAVAIGQVKLNHFAFHLSFLLVAPGTVQPQSFQISNNLNFLLSYINGTVFQPAGTHITAPDLLINLTDNSTGWLFSDSPMHWLDTVGTAENPFILPEPKLIPSNSSIQCALTNNTAATTFARVDISLIGVQVFGSLEGIPVYGA